MSAPAKSSAKRTLAVAESDPELVASIEEVEADASASSMGVAAKKALVLTGSGDSAQAVTTLTVAAAEGAATEWSELEDYTTEQFDKAFMADTDAKWAAMRKNQPVGVRHPDQALLLWSRWNRANLHCLDVDPAKVKVTRSEAKKKGPDGKYVGTGDFYVNFDYKKEQKGVDGSDDPGLRLLTCFGVPNFLMHGPTVSTGLEGSRGKVINGAAVEDQSVTYQHSLSAKPFNAAMADGDGCNPLFNMMAQRWATLADALLLGMVKDTDNLSQLRAELKKICKTRKIELPSSDDSLVDMIKSERLFAGKVKQEDEDDVSTKSLEFSVSVFRKKKVWREFGRVIAEEDVSTYKPPSDLFAKCALDNKGTPQYHNDIPVYRCRRAEEVEAGKKYDSPFIRIPSEQAVLNSSMVIAEQYKLGCYEWKLNRCGLTNKPEAYIFLNYRSVLKRMNLADVEPVDPRYAVPMAGAYLGPEAPFANAMALVPMGGLGTAQSSHASGPSTVHIEGVGEVDPQDFAD